MWLLFIVVVMVISVLMVFLIMAIRMLTGQAKDQLNRYFLKNLETYDRLAENKNAQISDLQRQVRDLEEKIDSAKERLAAMSSASAMSHPVAVQASAAGAGVAPTASYRDPGFLDDYAYVRQHMKMDYHAKVRELLDSLKDEKDPELNLCQDMLDKIPTDHLYEIITMQEGDQIEYLKELFDDEEDAYLDQYCMERGAFDLLAFHNDLKAYVREHGHEFYSQSGNPEEYQDLEAPNVHVVYDPGVHEGVRVSYKNTLYDFSI